MSFDLGSPAIEIAIALAFVFFLLSLIASAITEMLASIFKLRSSNLKKGVEGMLGDKDVAEELLAHPLIRTDLGLKKKAWQRKRDPSYISPRAFALAFLDKVDVATEGEQGKVTVQIQDRDYGGTQTRQVNGSLEAQLSALTPPPGAVLPDVPALERWFDESMDRVSGWYKRKSQLVTLLVAVALAVGLNVSALRIAEQLSAEPTVRAAVVAKAEAVAKEPATGKPGKEIAQAGKDMESALDQLSELKLPIFWVEEPEGPPGTTLVGWLITALAISLGAPFWFDTLNKLSNLRLAGKRPEDKPAGGAGTGSG